VESRRETTSEDSASRLTSTADRTIFPQFGTKNQGRPASARRERWGLSDPAATIGFERDVTVAVHHDRLVIGTTAVSVQTLYDATLDERLLRAVDEEVRAWGHPPRSFYWVPAIRFQVYPGGNAHYERLRRTAGRWGLQSSVEFLLPSATERTWMERLTDSNG
ncbi:MAG: hypothetical protein ACREIV_07695, partial [Planctomycetaceae bacterium]